MVDDLPRPHKQRGNSPHEVNFGGAIGFAPLQPTCTRSPPDAASHGTSCWKDDRRRKSQMNRGILVAAVWGIVTLPTPAVAKAITVVGTGDPRVDVPAVQA